MSPRRKAGISPAAKAGQPAAADPTEFVGRNDRGAVRPADDRYLADAELDKRDAYLLEVTGPDAQQLIAKREALRVLLDELTDEQLAELMPPGYEGSRIALLDHLEASATEMPNAAYRELLEAATAASATDDD
ncbi:hypothetical protein NPS01_42700 [Nocardioides psychrotolerans]|uniref:Uncharacterized protein n=1 Tax=Nocardioides psychrotolerans TaxID=1005945 RepID=A0A1I3MAZ9_9ACTN|nr:hypothetical protein [Nocardioides psychrotolerans]GEP40607.1 hypothetical protein NPS01_42700 [Nocardioides psychrotolerans]SFI94161.1 hypothetical protein SAMN05216561_11534 [Nocardioides psychrotolerans]